MVRPGRERLAGVSNERGAEEEGVSGRQTERKALIAVAAEERGRGLGRIRQRVRNASAASLMPFVEESVEPGSVVHTDGWLGYEPLEKKGYQHRIVFLSGRRKQASELLPRVHQAIVDLVAGQAAVSHEHLDYYLDEFVFTLHFGHAPRRGSLIRRSRRNCSRKLFYRLVYYRSIAPTGTLSPAQPQDVGVT